MGMGHRNELPVRGIERRFKCGIGELSIPVGSQFGERHLMDTFRVGQVPQQPLKEHVTCSLLNVGSVLVEILSNDTVAVVDHYGTFSLHRTYPPRALVDTRFRHAVVIAVGDPQHVGVDDCLHSSPFLVA